MKDFYDTVAQIKHLYSLLHDDLSRSIFWARLQYDINPSIDGILRLWELTGIPNADEMILHRKWKQVFRDIMQKGNQIIFYGAGIVGRLFAKDVLESGEDFSGFCDKNHQKYLDGILGKQVYSPDYLLKNKESCYVVITTNEFQGEILQFLEKNGFPFDHIVSCFSSLVTDYKKTAPVQYFEFPEFFSKGTAFVDAGCYDGADSRYFAEWCQNNYSKILAFEPDKANFEICKSSLEPLTNVTLFHGCLGERFSTARFYSEGRSHSRLKELDGKTEVADEVFQEDNIETIQILQLDDIAANEAVGFIKMDIEGAEMQALRGAKNTISKDKPFLAICVYHKPGDMLSIMDYLSGLVPEYHFWLRHYKFSSAETVLYASAKNPD